MPEHFRSCLESIRPWVDEMIVVDTGSVDETPRIVESFGGKLFHFPWCDDFSAARNESLRHATGDWLFWMDSDDTIPPECGRGLREAGREPERIRARPPTSCRFTAREAPEHGDPEANVTSSITSSCSQPARLAIRRKDARTDSAGSPAARRQRRLD